MKKSTIVVDDFYDNPIQVRDYALGLDYYYPYESEPYLMSGVEKYTWKSSIYLPSNQCPFKGSLDLIKRLENITGEIIDTESWNLGFPFSKDGKPDSTKSNDQHSCLWNCTFHFKPKWDHEIGEKVHNHVTDGWNSVGKNGWVGIIYLTPFAPKSTGLYLWNNIDPSLKYDWMTPKENWELVDTFGNIFNRLILCKGDIPHSGAAGWSDDMMAGRLFQTFFFKVKNNDSSADNLNIVIPNV